jgi:hypothetical protein
MLHLSRINLALAGTAILFLVSSYQLSVAVMHGLIEDELQSWQQRDIAFASYSDWEKKELLVASLVKLSPFNGLALQNSAHFNLLGSQIAGSSPATSEFAIGHQRQAIPLIRRSLS